ncbi:hypothetical protein [Azospirillum brasilense]|uniref:hypothetical protein n=1 Tax=Azospirillum brasilense TaxID=192 RepID=UPI000E0A9848|nr:hypothetical protein [Azospirillum brasilense]
MAVESARGRLWGYGCIVASALLFGVAGTAAKMMFVAAMPPLVMIAVRAMVSAAVLAVIMLALGRPIRARRVDLPFLGELAVWLTLVN